MSLRPASTNQNLPEGFQSFLVDGAELNYFYGSEIPLKIEFGRCKKTLDLRIFIQKEYSNNANLYRFATLDYWMPGSFQLVSTGFEKDFEDNVSDEWIATPSDTVLGIYPWRMPVTTSTSKTGEQSTVDACDVSDYSVLAAFDRIYSFLIGCIVDSWVLQAGYRAYSSRLSKRSRISVHVTPKNIILRGFNRQSISLSFTSIRSIKTTGPCQLHYDVPTRIRPETPKVRENVFADYSKTHDFSKTGDASQNISFTARVEKWTDKTSRQNIHRISTVIQEKFGDGVLYKASGTCRKRTGYGYKYWFGRIETFPYPEYPKWYYFISSFNIDVTTDTGLKLKQDTGLTVLGPMWLYWENNLIGKLCILRNGEHAYLTDDFQIVTFDGEVKRVHLVAQTEIGSNIILKYYIEECKY
jgi:hypothetical protein